MAISRALITTKDDFTPSNYKAPTVLGYPGREFNPYVYYNGEEIPNITPDYISPNGSRIEYGSDTPEFVPGIRGLAQRFSGRFNEYLNFKNWYLRRNMDTDRWMVSLWYTPSDLSKDWQGLITTRGDSYGSDSGFHIATRFNYLNVRGYGVDIEDMYTNGTDNDVDYPNGLFYFEVGKTYHIVVVSEPNHPTHKFQVWINGTLIIGSPKWIRCGWNHRSITVGNFLSSGTVHYPAYGDIDEVLFFAGNDQTPTMNEMREYYNYLTVIAPEARFIDYETYPGSIAIAKKTDGTYTSSPISWESDPIDIGDPPIDYVGRLQLTADFNPEYHTIQLFTRVSDNGINFDNWQAVGADGTLYSPSKRYYQIRVTLQTSSNTSTPIVKELEILEYEEPKQYELINEPLRMYLDLEGGLKPMGILNQAYDIWIEEEVKSKDIITFKIPMSDLKRRSLGSEAVEYLVRIGNRRYIVKENRDRKSSGGKKISEFKGEAKWYELNDPKVIDYELVEATIAEHIKHILELAIPTPVWKLGLNLSSIGNKRRTIRGKWKSVLQLFRELESTFGVELRFYYDIDNDQDLFDIVDRIGEDKRIRFYYNKNIKEIERTIDTYGMVTRLYLYGEGELTVSSVNGGKEYIENFTWVDKFNLRNRVRPDEFKDGRYTIPENLLEDGRAILEEVSKPNMVYVMMLLDLSSRSGHEPESIHLGDTVYPIDEDLMIDHLPSRIMRRKYNVREPHKTEVELDQAKKELADVQSRVFSDDIELLTEIDPVSSSDIQQMTVFNHLLNSRADDGLAEWTTFGSSGISASSEGGFSGENSFKIVSDYDEYKHIYQEVFNLSHRSTYTISAMVYKEGNITAGANGFVGIRVKVRYKPDDKGVVKEETKLLKIPDVTNLGNDEEE